MEGPESAARPSSYRPVRAARPDADVEAPWATPAERARMIERRHAPAQPRRAIDCQVAAVLESVTHGFLALDADWRITYANAAAGQLSDTAAESLVGRVHWDVWPETCHSEVETRYRAVVAEQRSAHFEHHYPQRGVWHDIHAFPTSGGGIAIVYRDVTEEHAAAAARDQYAAALAVRERELAVILETTTDAVVRFDRDLRATFANAAVSRVTGVPADAILGRAPAELGLPASLVERCRATLAGLLDAERAADLPPVTLTFELETPDGLRWFEAQAVLEPDADGRPAAVLVVARDVTVRVTAEQATAHALAAAEAANRAKAEFLAAMSHELRTPLNAIRGYAELMALGVHGPVTDGQRQCLERIQRSEKHLLGLITDILEYARIEAGRIAYESSPEALQPVLEDVLAWVERHAQAKGVALAADLCEVSVCGDARRVRQIVLNLLSNALKFTPAGGRVSLRCTCAGDEVLVEVQDTGPGIAPGSHDEIFLPFVQLNRARHNPIAGVGLGLAISREFARGMGGDLRVESVAGRGATFQLRLPRAGA